MHRVVSAMLALLLVACSASAGINSASPTSSPRARGAGPHGATTEAMVVDVIDGDTIKVRADGRIQSVRYIGVDAPERGDPGAREATAANDDLVAGRSVTLERDVSDTDRFGRLLRYVWIQQAGEWLLVNRALVRQGQALAKAYPPDTEYQALLQKAQKAARAAKVGMWDAGGQIRPLVPPASPSKPHRGDCDAAYPGVCIPPYPPDLDCGDIPFQNFEVLPPDPHGFDAEGDGLGCETY